MARIKRVVLMVALLTMPQGIYPGRSTGNDAVELSISRYGECQSRNEARERRLAMTVP